MTFPDVSDATIQSELRPRDQVRLSFDNTYSHLPERFYARVNPTPVRAPGLVKVNAELAMSLGLDPSVLVSPAGVEVLAGNHVLPGSEPIALAYAGHQFGHFVPELGDGRAILLGEVIGRDGIRYDVQLKGSGPTPFSRRGDGRAALGPVLREYIISEAMAALGVPTTRALAVVTTGENVLREKILPGAVLTRVAASHLRIGTFQYFAAMGDDEGLRTLADYAIARHYPEAAAAKHPYRAFLDAVSACQAALVVQWMLVGFVHGVMNTDNTSISGETIDYGPCAFMDVYDPATVFSSIDHLGRYAYGNQPRVMQWNLARLAEALLPLLGPSQQEALEAAQQAVAAFAPRFKTAHLAGLRRKLGLFTEQDGDHALAHNLLERMRQNRADITLTFRRLCRAAAEPEADTAVRSLFSRPEAYDAWAETWRDRLAQDQVRPEVRVAAMRAANPAVIPRNHLVEAALDAAVSNQDYAPFEELMSVLSSPYEERPGRDHYNAPASSDKNTYKTFCGT